MAFSTHLLTMEEVWFAREHPFDVKVVAVKKLVAEVESLEDTLEVKHDALRAAVAEMQGRMKNAR